MPPTWYHSQSRDTEVHPVDHVQPGQGGKPPLCQAPVLDPNPAEFFTAVSSTQSTHNWTAAYECNHDGSGTALSVHHDMEQLAQSLGEKLYDVSTPLLANYEVHLFEDTGDFASEVASMPVGTVTDCAELDDELSSHQSRISYLLSRLAKAANFLEANAGTLTDGAIEAYSSFFPTTSNDTNDIDKIFQGTLVAPSSVAHGEPCVTSVLVQFANEDDQHEVTGWSPLLIAWPSGSTGPYG